MDRLRVRAYNVAFGDAILVTVPDRAASGETVERHVLIDVGNVLVGEGGEDELFAPVVEDVLAVLGDRPLDLYVMTHEHMDHVQGLLWAFKKRGLRVPTRFSWLTASAAPDYYERFPDAREKKLAAMAAFETAQSYLTALQAANESPPVGLEALMLNNNPRSTADCVEFLSNLAETTTYVYRGTELEGTHPFEEAKLEVWGPEEDTSIYYGHFQPMALGVVAGGTAGAPAEVTRPKPPPGVDAGAFFDLLDRRKSSLFGNLFGIDRAANDSSVVFSLEWRGWRLLFPGDAEQRSWKEMGKRDLLRPIHFLKVGHHGSWNGTPTGDLLEAILPGQSPDQRPRSALVSTHHGTYNEVPSDATLTELRTRCQQVLSIGVSKAPPFIDLFFDDLT